MTGEVTGATVEGMLTLEQFREPKRQKGDKQIHIKLSPGTVEYNALRFIAQKFGIEETKAARILIKGGVIGLLKTLEKRGAL